MKEYNDVPQDNEQLANALNAIGALTAGGILASRGYLLNRRASNSYTQKKSITESFGTSTGEIHKSCY